MVNARSHPRSFPRDLLLLAGTFLLASSLAGQTTPAPVPEDAAKSAELPPEVLARLDKLKDALKATRAHRDTKIEAITLNQTGQVNYLTSDYKAGP
ncbi:MAG TPA: hypothetical protein VN829_03745 [Dongiaceae bacterium]|nr:hypothetical protein [Dongiaceae bacterium]HXR39391.1 hypothetical protein [Terracidiphilus sp.]